MSNGIDEKVFEMNVPLARRNLLYETSKTVLNVLGIAATLALILLLFGLREGLYTTLTAYVQRYYPSGVSSHLTRTRSSPPDKKA